MERVLNIKIKKSIIGLEENNFVDEIIAVGGENILNCFQCGTCTGGCPSGYRTAYRTRVTIRKALLGFKDEVISSDDIWLCTTCYTCVERCPRKVDPTDVILAIRNIAVKNGYMLKQHKMVCKFVYEHGHAVPINENIKNLRKKIGLPECPPTTHTFPDALDEVKKLIRLTDFDRIVGL
jgi:heterodisulfide reductase subunit C